MGIKHSRPVPPFMRYCSAIIPTMFDDSLSYYEALCALNRFIQKNLVEVINNNATVTEEYIKLANDLKEYVDNYFENLDVQEEINHKLDEMVEDGTMQELVNNYLPKKVSYYKITTSSTEDDLDEAFNDEDPSVIEFEDGVYNLTKTYSVKSNTSIVLNNAELHAEDDTRLFYLFDTTDTETTGYNGHHNISIIGGKLYSAISMIHAKNITFKDIYFYHGVCDHFLEICASQNVTVDNCKFEGVVAQANDRQYVENVQIENATYINFPWIADGSTTFDSTGCDNIEIKNCEFVQPDIVTYRLYTAIGGHTQSAGYPHSNISIHDCKVTDSISESFRMYNTVNIELYNNIFKQNGYGNPDNHDVNALQFLGTTENCNIHNNTIDGYTNQQLYINDGSKDVFVKNNIFTNMRKLMIDQTGSYTECNAIRCGKVDNLVVENNQFINILGSILWNRERSSDEKCTITFKNNVVTNPSDSTDLFYYRTRFYSCDYLTFVGNIFNEYPSSGNEIRLHSTLGGMFIKDNKSAKNGQISFDKNSYAGSYKDVYGIMLKAWEGTSSNLTNQTTNYKYPEFNKCILIYGDGAQTNAITVRAFNPAGKLDARSCVYPTCHQSDSAIAMGKIIFNSDDNKTVTTTGGNVNIRTVYFVNE